jgi:uncharacterized phage protein gp47/JayE
MNLPTRSFTDITRDMSAAITASAGKLIDLSVGSVLRAIIDANAAIVLWVQWLVLLTLQTTRAATSSGSDLDTWMADFSLLRLPAVAATGVATFSRYSATVATNVPTGTIIKTTDGSVSFTVAPDPSNPAWLVSSGSYFVSVGVTAIDLPIIAASGGAVGNVLPQTITVLASAVPGIDFVDNENQTSGGGDPESDADFRVRFANFFAARSRATIDAIGYAISQVGANLTYLIQENVDASGTFRPGNILIVVDDGSGTLGQMLFESLSVAIEAVRPVGTIFSIQPPQVVEVQISLSMLLPLNVLASVVQNLVQSATQEYVNTLPIGGLLSATRISQLVYQVDSQIINISDISLNGLPGDLTAPPTGSFQFLGMTFT